MEQLSLIEIFSSVQGETSYSGLPTTFIRLAQCNLRCTWCDTPYSFKRGELFSIEKILEKVRTFGCRYVCITGGEPLLQKSVHSLIKQLADEGYQLSLETGGSLPIHLVDPRVKVILDIKCPGSGMAEKNDWRNIEHLKAHDEVKFVILDQTDYEYAKTISEKYALSSRVQEILFSPVFNLLNPETLVKWILTDRLNVRLNLQIHKWIWSPETRGV